MIKEDFDSISHPKIRELTFQAYFALQSLQNDPKLLIQLLMKQLKMTKKQVRSAVERALAVKDSEDRIEGFIEKAKEKFDIDVVRPMEMIILKYVIYELCVDPVDTQKHIINEMVRLTKKFHTASFAKYINALLDYLYKSSDEYASSSDV